MEEALTAIARYMVMKRLCGDLIALLAIKEYLLDGVSPSIIAYKYKVSKFKVRGYIQRIIDKAGNYRLATRMVETLYPHVMSIDPVMLRAGNRLLCTICNIPIRSSDAEFHLRRKHKELVNSLTSNVVSRALLSRT